MALHSAVETSKTADRTASPEPTRQPVQTSSASLTQYALVSMFDPLLCSEQGRNHSNQNRKRQGGDECHLELPCLGATPYGFSLHICTHFGQVLFQFTNPVISLCGLDPLSTGVLGELVTKTSDLIVQLGHTNLVHRFTHSLGPIIRSHPDPSP